MKKENLEERSESLLKLLLDHESLRKFSANELLPISQAFGRIFLLLLEKKLGNYYMYLNKAHFGTFFVNFTKKQLTLLSIFIKSKTEDIHVLQVINLLLLIYALYLIKNYAAEANIRLKIFEAILQGDSLELKLSFLEVNFILAFLLLFCE